MSIDQIINILECPRSKTDLMRSAGFLVSPAGWAYPIIKNRVVLTSSAAVPDESLLSLAFPKGTKAAISEPTRNPVDISLHTFRDAEFASQVILNFSDDGEISLVVELDRLPLKPGSINSIVVNSVFRAVLNPTSSIAELNRVLRLGGLITIHTTFNRAYQEDSDHLANYTPVAIEGIVGARMKILDINVAYSSGATKTLSETLKRFVGDLPHALTSRLRRIRIGDLIDDLEAHGSLSSEIEKFSSLYLNRSLCETFAIVAEKTLVNVNIADADAQFFFNYARQKMDLIHRHHEVALYRERAVELDRRFVMLPAPPDLNEILEVVSISPNTTELGRMEKLRLMRGWQVALSTMRSEWIARC